MPAHSMYCAIQGNRNCLTRLGALQKQDHLNPVFISGGFGYFGNTYRKNMAQNLGYKIPIGVETATIKDDLPIQQQIDATIKPQNTALKVGFNRMIGDMSDSMPGGRFIKQPLGDTNDRIIKQSGTGIFDRIGDAISAIGFEGMKDIAEAGSELVFGPIGTAISNIASEKFNKNPNWREGFPGEKHAIIDTPWGLTRANYLGPGTNLLVRLERRDPPVDGPNGLDSAARSHDIAYGLARTAEDVRDADDQFLQDLSNVESSTKMKNFVMMLFRTKKLAEDVGFLDPSKFAPDIKKELSGMGFDKAMARAGSFSAENVMMGVGHKANLREISKFFHGAKKDLSEPLKQLRSIAFSVPGVEQYLTDASGRRVEEVIEEFLPGQQLREKLVGMAKQKKRSKKKSKKGKGFSAENVMMGVGIPKQDEFSGHILAGGVPQTGSQFTYGVTGDRLAHEGIYHGIGQPGGRESAKIYKVGSRKKRKRTQEGGQLIASLIAGVVVPELIKFVSGKISKAIKGKKKKRKKKR